MANPFATYLERFLANTGHAAAPTLEDSLNYIRSGASQAEKGRPEMLTAGHQAARENLNNVFMVDIGGGKLVNLAPNSPRLHVKTADGRILQFPKSAREEAAKAGTVMNFSPKQIEEALPPAPPKPAPAPTAEVRDDVEKALEVTRQRRLAEEAAAPPPRAPIDPSRKGLASSEEAMIAESEKLAQQEAEQARITAAAANVRKEAEARGFQDARNKLEAEGRVFPAEPAKTPTVQLAEEAIAAPRAAPISGATPTVATAEASGNPFADRIKTAMQGEGAQVPPVVQQAAARPASGTVPSAGRTPDPSVPRGPWNPRPAPAAPYDPLKSQFTLGTEASLWAAPPAALAYGAYMAPSKEEALQKKMLAAVQAGQPSEDLNPSENDIQAALRIAKQRAEESAARSASVQGMQDQDERELEADRTMRAQIPSNYYGNAVERGWQGTASNPLDREENIKFSDIAGGAARRPTGASSTTPVRPAASSSAAPASTSSSTSAAPASSSPAASFLSSIFNRPASTQQLFKQSDADPSDSGAWMRAERQYAKTHPDGMERNFDVTKLDPTTGMNRGGTAKAAGPHKDAALHKALDIIHAMMMRGR